MSPSKSRFDPNYRLITSEIIAARTSRGLSQAWVASELGFTQSTWSKIESGERRVDVLELRRFCQLLDVGFISFLQEIEDKML